ncbi:MAG: hypothetical protein WBC04_25745 [Candidatus Acidiferrales bacterium]
MGKFAAVIDFVIALVAGIGYLLVGLWASRARGSFNDRSRQEE